MCCDTVAMRAVSRCCQLKSLGDERWRRPLNHREFGERTVPRPKRRYDTRLEWAPACTCNVLFGDLLSFKSDTRKEAPLRGNGRVRPALRGWFYERVVSREKPVFRKAWFAAVLLLKDKAFLCFGTEVPRIYQMGETRKLAAILAADVVGYSRLACVYEERTLARLRALRTDLIDPSRQNTADRSWASSCACGRQKPRPLVAQSRSASLPTGHQPQPMSRRPATRGAAGSGTGGSAAP